MMQPHLKGVAINQANHYANCEIQQHVNTIFTSELCHCQATERLVTVTYLCLATISFLLLQLVYLPEGGAREASRQSGHMAKKRQSSAKVRLCHRRGVNTLGSQAREVSTRPQGDPKSTREVPG